MKNAPWIKAADAGREALVKQADAQIAAADQHISQASLATSEADALAHLDAASICTDAALQVIVGAEAMPASDDGRRDGFDAAWRAGIRPDAPAAGPSRR